jgi:hypothetical protein
MNGNRHLEWILRSAWEPYPERNRDPEALREDLVMGKREGPEAGKPLCQQSQPPEDANHSPSARRNPKTP